MFECDDCGLKHDHKKGYHSIEDEFSVSSDYVKSMDWNKDCNCGIHELFRDVKNGIVSLPDDEERRLQELKKTKLVPRDIEEKIY
jgi:hypothetical protein